MITQTTAMPISTALASDDRFWPKPPSPTSASDFVERLLDDLGEEVGQRLRRARDWMGDDGGVAAVDRALSILDALTKDRVSLSDLSKRTDLYKGTVLRLLKSLEKFGYVLRSADGSYRLGSKVLHLGSLYQRHFRTSDIVPLVLERLGAELHEGGSFYVCEDDQRICLRSRRDDARGARLDPRRRSPAAHRRGAAAEVLRAFSGARGERFDEIRHKMYAASFGERDSETTAVAVPVLGPGNKLVGALSV